MLVERREDACGDEAVERLLGAFVRVVDEIGKGGEHGIEKLCVECDHHLLVDTGRIVIACQVVETNNTPVLILEGDKPRLHQVHAPGQDGDGTQFTVGEIPGNGCDLERDLSDPGWRLN